MNMDKEKQERKEKKRQRRAAEAELVSRLTRACDKATSMVEQTQTWIRTFKRLSQECASRINEGGTAAIQHYLTQWFERLVSIKDECFVSLTGEVKRKHHLEILDGTFHTRGSEQKFYKGTTSRCSVDGLNYDFRKLMDTSLESTQEILENTLSNRIEALDETVQRNCKNVDEISQGLVSALEIIPDVLLIEVKTEFLSEELAVDFYIDSPEMKATAAANGMPLRPGERLKAAMRLVRDLKTELTPFGRLPTSLDDTSELQEVGKRNKLSKTSESKRRLAKSSEASSGATDQSTGAGDTGSKDDEEEAATKPEEPKKPERPPLKR